MADLPPHFRCPISLELMQDPVTVYTGQTYDRTSIESWLAAGHRTCPVTRAHLPSLSLIPNLTLRRLILLHTSPDPSLSLSLLSLSLSSTSPVQDRTAALHRLASSRAVIPVDRRAPLLSLSFSGSDAVSDAALTLTSVSLTPLSTAERAYVACHVDRLSTVLVNHGLAEVREAAARIVEAAAAELSSAAPVAAAITATLRRPGPECGAALGALLGICLKKEGRERAAAAGAAEAAAERIGRGGIGEAAAEKGLAAVELLCREAAGRAGVAGSDSAVAELVAGLEGGTERAAEHAAGALVAVCRESVAARRVAVRHGAVGRLLVMVQRGCTERGKRKAQALLRMLRPAWPACDDLAVSDDFPVSAVVASSSSSASYSSTDFSFQC